MNSFVKVNTLGAGANNARTENGALSYATMGKEILDQFGKAGSYRGRDIDSVWADQKILWAENPEMALKFPFYLRMITRKTNLMRGKSTEKVQRGVGARDESFKRLLWIAKYHPDEFYRNLWILPLVGSWKDLWVLMSMDDANSYLDKAKFFSVIAEGINDKANIDLVKKYAPRIRAVSKCHTDWAKRTNALAKEFCQFAGWTYSDYRTFKSTGKAHEFQRIICSGQYKNIKWNLIPGKALLNLVSGQFLSNHNLMAEYIKWVESQPTVKFNGYAFELGRKLNHMGNNKAVTMATEITVDKQFENLLATGKSDNGAITGNVLCALDTSGSMTGGIDKYGTTAFDVCASLGIYFARMNTGAFNNTVAMFDSTSRLLQLKGSFSDMLTQIIRQEVAWGSTNFQSLIDLIVKTRNENPDIPLEDYPKTLLVVSDMQFNPTGSYYYDGNSIAEKTNFETAVNKLKSVFPDEFVKDFKIIWWYVAGGRNLKDFPSTMEHSGTYMFSGFDGAVISFLLGGDASATKENGEPASMEDIINTAFSQEVMNLIS